MSLPHEQLARSSRQIERSAGAVKESAAQLTDSADRRTELAGDRTVLAMERTYAAWVRTGLAALASGVGAAPLLDRVLPGVLVSVTGSVLILFSAFCSSPRSGATSLRSLRRSPRFAGYRARR